MLFANDHRAACRARNPGLSMAAIAKQLAAEFNALSPDARAQYDARAASEKARHAELMAALTPEQRAALAPLRKYRPPTEEQWQRQEAQEQEAAMAAVWAAAEARLPQSASYHPSKVPQCAPDLSSSSLIAPTDRTEWFLCLGEIVALCNEATRRHAVALAVSPAPSPMPVAYLAERLDTDEPLWGWQVREREHGWLQGFVTLTTFTTWSATFEFNAEHAQSGLPSARLQNARIATGRADEDPTLHVADDGESVAQVAAARGLDVSALAEMNADWFPTLRAADRLLRGTVLRVAEPPEADLDPSPRPDDTPKAVAERHRLPLGDLIAINHARFAEPDGGGPCGDGSCAAAAGDGSPGHADPNGRTGAASPGPSREPASMPLCADTPLHGRPMLLRDRETEVEMPEVHRGARKKGRGAAGAAAQARRVDGGEMTRALALEPHEGDPHSEGVVWPRIAEVGMVCALGCGSSLLHLAIGELAREGKYKWVVLQATLAAVGFYERHGFVRVGAVARYAEKEADLAGVPLTGYRHWAAPDELMAEQFGDLSYLMALELAAWAPPRREPSPERLDEYRPITTMEKAKDLRRQCTLEAGRQCYESGDGVVVSLVPAGLGGGKLGGAGELRMEVRYEVDCVLDKRGEGEALEYQVRWKKWPSPSWEPAANLSGAKAAIRKFEKRSGAPPPTKRGAKGGKGGGAGSAAEVGGEGPAGTANGAAEPERKRPR